MVGTNGLAPDEAIQPPRSCTRSRQFALGSQEVWEESPSRVGQARICANRSAHSREYGGTIPAILTRVQQIWKRALWDLRSDPRFRARSVNRLSGSDVRRDGGASACCMLRGIGRIRLEWPSACCHRLRNRTFWSWRELVVTGFFTVRRDRDYAGASANCVGISTRPGHQVSASRNIALRMTRGVCTGRRRCTLRRVFAFSAPKDGEKREPPTGCSGWR